LPQIGELKYQESFDLHSIDGAIVRGIVDLNKKKIRNLSTRDLREINIILKANADITDYWGYHYYESSKYHTFVFIWTRISLITSAMLAKGRRGLSKLANKLAEQTHARKVFGEG
jgi:hypothetical protein